MTEESLSVSISKALARMGSKPFNYKQIAAAAHLGKGCGRIQVETVLAHMAQEGMLEALGKGKYKVVVRSKFVTGVIDRNTNGKTHVVEDGSGEKFYIADRNLKTAMKGDRVRAVLYAHRSGRQREAEVVEILERTRDTFVGVLSIYNNIAFVVVDNRILTNDIYVPIDRLNGAENGQKVFVKLLGWPANAKNPIGEIIDIIGNPGENNTEMHAILLEYGLPYSYPEEVAAAADLIPTAISPEEIARRMDFRSVPTFTIDPEDAKDFDDALSFRTLSDGLYEVGVHIADVTHYVRPGDEIDKEAYARATSVYLVDRTVPMLPEKLCNEVCSLRPNEEKLCYSAIFKIDSEGYVKSSKIGRTVIKSCRRFTYDEAQSVIETGSGDLAFELTTLDSIAKKMRERRFSRGAIDFETTEVRFRLDEKGVPIDVYFKESKDANKLIEEFMLLANRSVAEHIGRQKGKTFVYRIHDVPDQEKLENLSKFIKPLGYKLKLGGKKNEVSTSINRLLDSVAGTKEQNLIQTVAIRSMAKAKYSTVNIGHYGLAMDFYTHFTSPIRRYPDMMVHRLLDYYDHGGSDVDKGQYEEYCEHCSAREQLATSAERSSIKYKQVEYMGDKRGQVFDGVISGVTEWGIYVEINCNKCEGMVPVRELDDDYYVYDKKNYCMTGRHTKRTYRLGDEVSIKVSKVNLDKKQLDFVIVK